MGVVMVVAMFGRFDAPITQTATWDLGEVSEGSFRMTSATGVGMEAVRKVYRTLDKCVIMMTFAAGFTRPIVYFAISKYCQDTEREVTIK